MKKSFTVKKHIDSGTQKEIPPNPAAVSSTRLYVFLIVTTVFLFFYAVPYDFSDKMVREFPRPLKPEWTEAQKNTKVDGFLVYSKVCKIPDLDPFDSSVKSLIEISDPLNCSSSYPAATYSRDNVLFIDQNIIRQKGIEDFKCCYQTLSRDNEGTSDEGYKLSKECKKLEGDETHIEDEFIKVRCSYFNETIFYENFHSFIQKKPQVEERCRNSTAKFSILIIGVDSVSRLNMHRQLNKTANYLLEEMGAMEMYGFNKVGDNTFPNLVPTLSGYDARELPEVCWKSSNQPLDNCDLIWKQFKNKGYRTLYAEDTPHISSFNYVKRGFYYQPTDYYFRPFMLAYEKELGRDLSVNCYLCLGSVSETEAVLHWGEKFALRFKDKPYFSFLWINSLTHDLLNKGSSGDHMYERFFRNLHTSGALDNTIIIFMGDHGMRYGAIRRTYLGRFEERLPMLLIALPPNFKSAHPLQASNLEYNRHRLITPFDLYATLQHLLHENKQLWKLDTSHVAKTLKANFTRRALSLFNKIPEERSCSLAAIDRHWCTCEMSIVVNTSSPAVKMVGSFVVDELNAILKPQSKTCALLRLNVIFEARMWNPPKSKTTNSKSRRDIYTVVISTLPGKAIFEATVQLDQVYGKSEILGSISRLNLYGDQSVCVKNAELRKYCYCVNST